jgi:hypothetical protein
MVDNGVGWSREGYVDTTSGDGDGEKAVMDRASALKGTAAWGFCPITSGLAAHISEKSIFWA